MESEICCPLPELADVLWPYIKPRKEATEIRQAIDSTLRDNVTRSGLQLSKITLANEGFSPDFMADSRFQGVRKAYIQALRVRRDAQKRFDALKSELSKSHGQHGSDRFDVGLVDTIASGRVSSIRQSQLQGSLRAVDAILDDLESHHQSFGGVKSDDIARSEGHNLPLPPASRSEYGPRHTDKDSEIFQLKKAFLRARTHVKSLDSSATHDQMVPDSQSLTHGTRAYALQRARDDLISWIESELAKISDNSDDQITNNFQQPAAVPEGHSLSLEDDTVKIHDLYARYVDARKRLIRIATTTTSLSDDHSEPPEVSPINQAQAQRESLSSAMLAYITTLRTLSEDEPAMMQQTSYLRRQLTHDSTTTQQLVIRLADESHIVAPGTRDVFAWAEATEGARTRDKAIVQTALKTGEQSIRGAQQKLRD